MWGSPVLRPTQISSNIIGFVLVPLASQEVPLKEDTPWTLSNLYKFLAETEARAAL